MSIFLFLALLVFGIVAIVQGTKTQEYKNATFWFLLSFWFYLLVTVAAGAFVGVHLVTAS
jgi:phosphoglycerol transferase MdoB-like AlkP superfamily enzyme